MIATPIVVLGRLEPGEFTVDVHDMSWHDREERRRKGQREVGEGAGGGEQSTDASGQPNSHHQSEEERLRPL